MFKHCIFVELPWPPLPNQQAPINGFAYIQSPLVGGILPAMGNLVKFEISGYQMPLGKFFSIS